MILARGEFSRLLTFESVCDEDALEDTVKDLGDGDDVLGTLLF